MKPGLLPPLDMTAETETSPKTKTTTTTSTVIAVIAKLQFLFGILLALGAGLGFGFTTPSKQMESMQRDIAAVRVSNAETARMTRVLAQWICLREREQLRPQYKGQSITTGQIGCDDILKGPAPLQAGAVRP